MTDYAAGNQSDRLEEPSMQPSEIKPLLPHTGAEAVGIKLNDKIDDASCRALNAAFTAHGVLVIRNQTLSPQELLSVARQSGWRSATIRMTFGNRDELIIRRRSDGGKCYVGS
jgi:hypothetical protein